MLKNNWLLSEVLKLLKLFTLYGLNIEGDDYGFL